MVKCEVCRARKAVSGCDKCAAVTCAECVDKRQHCINCQNVADAFGDEFLDVLRGLRGWRSNLVEFGE